MDGTIKYLGNMKYHLHIYALGSSTLIGLLARNYICNQFSYKFDEFYKNKKIYFVMHMDKNNNNRNEANSQRRELETLYPSTKFSFIWTQKN